jgi:hypothetical protein
MSKALAQRRAADTAGRVAASEYATVAEDCDATANQLVAGTGPREKSGYDRIAAFVFG